LSSATIAFGERYIRARVFAVNYNPSGEANSSSPSEQTQHIPWHPNVNGRVLKNWHQC